MMMSLSKGRYRARVAQTPLEIQAAQALRARAFRTGAARDADAFDATCLHFLIDDCKTGALVACFRIMPFGAGQVAAHSYTAQFYDLSALQQCFGPTIEMGRFCLDPACHDPDVLRVAWAALTRYIDENSVEMMFGCTSFPGVEAGAFLDVFALLHHRHLAPDEWRPRCKARDVFKFSNNPRRHPDIKAALQAMPPLLRTYLGMGGRVSDHAVVDRQMNTLHVFTGVEVRAIPAARQRQLRALAGQGR